MGYRSRLARRAAAGIGSGALVLSMAAAPPAAALPAAAAPVAAQDASEPDAPTAFAQDETAVVTMSSGWAQDRPGRGRGRDVPESTVEVAEDGALTLRLAAVEAAEVVTAGQGRFETRDAVDAWSMLGSSPVGVVQGQTADGERVQVPVVFTAAQVSGGTVVVSALPQGGHISPLAAEYVPHLEGVVDPTLPSGGYSQLAVTGWPAASDAWRWSATGTGEVEVRGDRFTVRFTSDTARAAGVQPGGQSATAQWSDIVDRWSAYAGQGTPARLVVTGAHAQNRNSTEAENAILLPTNLSLQGDTLVVTGTVPGHLTGAGRSPAVPKRGQDPLLVSLETPAGGSTTSFVVVAGDSIASGEGARYAGTYINPALQRGSGGGTPSSEDVANRVQLFCDSVDLACTKAVIGEDGKVTYEANPGLVYEDGSWEDAAIGEACHRSRTAPGTWLARYYSTQLGLDVESITLACSGATTENIIDTPFKGEAPQSQDLADLAAWLPISHVVATIGANDIRFSEIATQCLLAPVNAILGEQAPPGGSINPADVLQGVSKILDDVLRAEDGTVQPINPYFDPTNLCSEAQRPIVEQAVAEVRGKVAAAMQALHAAAPDAEVVLTNYPSLVPSSTHTYFPRQEWFESFRPLVLEGGPNGEGPPDCSADPRPAACGDPGEYLAPWRVELQGAGASYWPSPDFFDSDPRAEEPFVDGVLAGNPMNRLIAQNIYPGNQTESGQELLVNDYGDQVIQSWGFNLTPLANILGYGATQFGFDQDWAATEVVPSLNRAVLAGLGDADPSGDWSTPVDMTQVLNGRELGGKFVGHENGPFDAVWGIDTSSYPPPTLGAGPTVSRAQMVNNVFSGQAVPFVCPGPDSVAGAAGPECIGDLQEALHPNWRGQAAEGQCIVAVVTGAFGQTGNACVRSIGDGSAAGRSYTGGIGDLLDPTLFTDVPGADALCLTDLENAYSTEDGQYQPCTSTTPADPTWDTERWDQGAVTWDGQDVHWR